MNLLNAYGLFTFAAMVICYALEEKNWWFVLAFSFSCLMGAAHVFLLSAWSFGMISVMWALIAFRKWYRYRST